MQETTSAKQDEREVYVLVGAYSGVGCALAKRLYERGARLMLVGRDEEKLALVADQVDAAYIVADATSFDDMSEVFELALTKFGRIDGVASMVSSAMLKPAHLTSETDYDCAIAANLKAAFAVVRSATHAMLNYGGSIVIVSSQAGRNDKSTYEAVSAAKAGAEGLVRSAAASYAHQKVRVNCVAAGLSDSDLSRMTSKADYVDQGSISAETSARAETAGQIARVIHWLLGRDCSITGQTIGIDGGLSTVRFKNPIKWSRFHVPNHCTH